MIIHICIYRYHVHKNLKATKSKEIKKSIPIVKKMLLETTEVGVQFRWESLPNQTREYFEHRNLDIQRAAIAYRWTTAFGPTICGSAESLNNADERMDLRNMMVTSMLLHFSTYTHGRLVASFDKIRAVRDQIG